MLNMRQKLLKLPAEFPGEKCNIYNIILLQNIKGELPKLLMGNFWGKIEGKTMGEIWGDLPLYPTYLHF